MRVSTALRAGAAVGWLSACSVYDLSLLDRGDAGASGGGAGAGAAPDAALGGSGSGGSASGGSGGSASGGSGDASVEGGAPDGAALDGATGAGGTPGDGGLESGPDAAPPATCSDGKRNGAETDLDCGRPCLPCAPGSTCATGDDCAGGVCAASLCQPPSCVDTVTNGRESDRDCGGGCPGCTPGQRCGADADCASGVCRAGACEASSCSDGVRNALESDRDCGGSCAPCAPGGGCAYPTDCSSGVCQGGRCSPPTCLDAFRNGTETDTDCGGSCDPCPLGQRCAAPGDCASTVCSAGVCAAPQCSNGATDPAESDTDCGGSCGPCADGKRCALGTDCTSGVCAVDLCATASCTDSVKNGTETGTDCGGGCAPCPAGSGCSLQADCESGVCAGSLCQAPSCSDGVKNAAETDLDCGGGTCGGCGTGSTCGAAGDCLSAVCTAATCRAATCADSVKNGDETGSDCGGSCLPCGYRRALTIRGGEVPAPLTDFPVLVTLTDVHLGAATRADGADLSFRDGSGGLLDVEIDSFDRAAGRLVAWVRVPTIAAGTDTVLWLQYGDTRSHFTGATGRNPSEVFRNAFTRVWHLEDAGNLRESRSGATATSSGATSVPGQIGGAVYLDGNDSLFAAHAALDGASFTVSLWLRRADSGVDRCALTQGRISAAPATRQLFHFCYEQDVNPSVNNHFRFGFWNDDLLSASAYTETTSHEHWVGTFDVASGARVLYRNGVSAGANSAGGSLSTGSDPFEFGRRVYHWDYRWNGNLDEVRVASVARSAAWVAAEHANQRAGSTFLAVGPREAL